MVPQIVQTSALGQWRTLSDHYAMFQNSQTSDTASLATEYTYDLIEAKANGLVLRVTARIAGQPETMHSLEYLIRKDINRVPVLSYEKPYVNALAYGRFIDTNGKSISQGGMGERFKGRLKVQHSYESYLNQCNDKDIYNRQMSCFRPYLNSEDFIDGDVEIAGPLTILGTQSFINKSTIPSVNSFHANGWPRTTTESRVRFFADAPNQLVSPALTTVNPSGSRYGYYSLSEVATHLPNYEYVNAHYAGISPPATFADLRNRANILATSLNPSGTSLQMSKTSLNVCRFVGPTQIVMNGDTFYVRSPHTPNDWNTQVYRSPDWCKNATQHIWGVTKNSRDLDADITTSSTQSNSLSPRPGTENSWVTISNVPTDAVFLVENTVPSKCNQNVISPFDHYPNITGLGYPGRPNAFIKRVGQYSCYHGDVFIDGLAAQSRTVAAEHNAYLTGGIRYRDRDFSQPYVMPSQSKDYFGLISQQNIIIYNNPEPIIPQVTNSLDDPRLIPSDWRYPHSFFMHWVDPNISRSWGNWNLDVNAIETHPHVAVFRTPQKPSSQSHNQSPIWLALPQWDGFYVAEQGGLFYDFFPMDISKVHNTEYAPLKNGKLLFFGSLYSKYAPLTHIDFIQDDGHGAKVYVAGLLQRYVKDDRLDYEQPPGFFGKRDSSYRFIRFAETSNHIALP